MRRRWKIVAAIALGGVFAALLTFNSGRDARRAWTEARSSLRREGFKLYLPEFNPPIAAAISNRADTLAGDELALRNTRFGGLVEVLFNFRPLLMTEADSNSAVVVWRQSSPDFFPGQPLWPAARAFFEENQAVLDEARSAALSGPIRFADVIGMPAGMRVGDPIKRLADEFAVGTVLALHDGKSDVAWTNLIVATRLATGWDPGPLQIAQAERFRCAATAFDVAWQALQSDDWTDEQLAALQREWESADFLGNLPDMVAYRRASAMKTCAANRRLARTDVKFSRLFHSWWNAASNIKGYWEQVHYLRSGTYADEQGLLLYLRDREIEMRHAIQSPSWPEMRGIINAGNATPFKPTAYPESGLSVSKLQWGLTLEQKNDCAPRAAEAETRRRIVITAIALIRYRARYGSYPATVQDLVPDFLPRPPIDFMDGAPLRYVLDDGQFVLYSVGGSPVDDAINPMTVRVGTPPKTTCFAVAPGVEAKLVWPRPAATAEM